jgi:hypothetical protein
MWPWEHLAVGYLLYSASVRLRTGSGPGDGPALALALSTQFPDLVDKPLAWSLGVLPDGTTVAHSVFVAVPAVVVVAALERGRAGGRYAPAIGIGYLSGLLAEFGRYFADFVAFLGTPLGRLYLLLELILVGTAILVWIRDGVPGLEPVTAPFQEAVSAE